MSKRTCSTAAACGVVSLFSALGCSGGGDPPTCAARQSVVYGQDDRREQDAYPAGSRLHTWARSSAMLVGVSSLRRGPGSDFVLVTTENLRQSMKASGKPLCSGEPFQDEPTFVGVCSAFLAAPDVVVTAGHCMTPSSLCPEIAVVFGVSYDEGGRDPSRHGADDVYFCQEVLDVVLHRSGADYAVVRLDRPVVGRAPLPLRGTGKIADDEDLVLIGNPLGLPTKISTCGRVLDNAPASFFVATTNAYGGESGAPVLGARSGLVEGILVRGEKDFMRKGDCWVSKVCPEGAGSCRGEDVTRATIIAAALGHGAAGAEDCQQD